MQHAETTPALDTTYMFYIIFSEERCFETPEASGVNIKFELCIQGIRTVKMSKKQGKMTRKYHNHTHTHCRPAHDTVRKSHNSSHKVAGRHLL